MGGSEVVMIACCAYCKQTIECTRSTIDRRLICAPCAAKQLADFRARCAERAKAYAPPVVKTEGS